MKNLLLIIAVGIFGTTIAQGDNNELAKKILAELSEEAKSYKTMTIDFKLAIKSSDINESQTGKAYTKGTKYYYSTNEREVFCDGTTVWTFMKEDNECYIDDAKDVSSDFNPSEIMSIWDKNFNYQYIKEEKSGETTLHEIKLFPKDPKNSKYHTVILKVDRSKKQVSKVIIKTKDGLTLMFNITKLVPNQDVSDSKFKWEKAKHPGVEEIDNR